MEFGDDGVVIYRGHNGGIALHCMPTKLLKGKLLFCFSFHFLEMGISLNLRSNFIFEYDTQFPIYSF